MFKIPFKYLPASWGLKGKSYEIAKAEYELDGYELEHRLLQINGGSPDDFIDLDVKHGKIPEYSGECKKIQNKFPKDSKEYKLAIFELNAKFGLISQQEFERFKADLNDEPYITVVNSSYDSSNGSSGLSIEFDWNKKWIDLLVSEGYNGRTEEDIVHAWFNELLKTMAVENTMTDPSNFNPSRVVATSKSDDGKIIRK